jgi:hypothetical protein
MKAILATSILTLAAAAIAQDQPPRFTLVTASSNSALHMKTVNASGQQFWVGKPTASYCPVEQVGTGCPAGSITSVSGGNITLGMNVMVPGGQQGKEIYFAIHVMRIES